MSARTGRRTAEAVTAEVTETPEAEATETPETETPEAETAEATPEAETPEATKTEALKVYSVEYEAEIAEKAGAAGTAEKAVTLCRTALGAVVGRAVAALTSAGLSAEEAQARIMLTVTEALSAVGAALVDWETVSDWVRAATVEGTLPEDLKGRWSTEALKTIGRIPEAPKAEGSVTRAEFAEALASEGVTAVRAIREAVKAEQGTAGKSKATPARKDQSEKAVKALKGLLKKAEAETDFDISEMVEMYGAEAVTAVVMLGVDLRTKAPKFQRLALLEAVAEFVTPEGTAAPEADGSGADDTETPEAEAEARLGQ